MTRRGAFTKSESALNQPSPSPFISSSSYVPSRGGRWGRWGSLVHSSAHNCAHASHNTTSLSLFGSVILCTGVHCVAYNCAQTLEHVGQSSGQLCTHLYTNVHKHLAGTYVRTYAMFVRSCAHICVHVCTQILVCCAVQC